MSGTSRATQVIAVIALVLFWSLNWPMMKAGLSTVEPWTFRALLVLCGGVGSLSVALMGGQSIRIPREDWSMLLALSFFQGCLWNAFSGFGIAMIDAGRASVLAFTMPVWATVLSIYFLGERVSRKRLVGLFFGLMGIALLLAPAFVRVSQEVFGSLLMVAGAMSWGAATVVFKAAGWRAKVLAVTGWHFLIGGIPLFIAAFAIGEPSTLMAIRGQTAVAVLYSATIPMVLCQFIWFRIVERIPANLASMGTLFVPVLGVFFSALILGESIGALEIAALILVFLAMLLILPGISLQATLRRPQSSRPG